MPMSIREEFEKRERSFMSPFACPSSRSKGRRVAEKPCAVRTAFQLDRDRIVYCNAFRRLKHKTQVFLAPMIDDTSPRPSLWGTISATPPSATAARRC